jgi:hypothetical protein
MVEVKLHFGESLLLNFFHLFVFQRGICVSFQIFGDSELFDLFVNIVFSQEMNDFWVIFFPVVNKKASDLVTL